MYPGGSTVAHLGFWQLKTSCLCVDLNEEIKNTLRAYGCLSLIFQEAGKCYKRWNTRGLRLWAVSTCLADSSACQYIDARLCTHGKAFGQQWLGLFPAKLWKITVLKFNIDQLQNWAECRYMGSVDQSSVQITADPQDSMEGSRSIPWPQTRLSYLLKRCRLWSYLRQDMSGSESLMNFISSEF